MIRIVGIVLSLLGAISMFYFYVLHDGGLTWVSWLAALSFLVGIFLIIKNKSG